METTANSQVSELIMQNKGLIIIFGVIGFLAILLIRCNGKERQRTSNKVITKPLGLKNIVDLKLKKALESLDTDIKSFKGLKQSEVEAITLKNTRLNSGSRRSSKSLSDIRVDKLDGTKKMTLSGFKKQAFTYSFEDLRSSSTFSSLNSDENLLDLKVKCVQVSPSNMNELKDGKRVSFI